MFEQLKEDIATVKERDPAAKSGAEILFLYPGLKAIRMYRKAHWFWTHNHKFIARSISQRAVRKTGIEIHPGAQIGRRVFIDHGSGIVIGETAIVGDDVLIYQGVTLGGRDNTHEKRHPTVENGVLLSTDATILGNIRIGAFSKIGAGAVVLKDVPPYSTVVGVPGVIKEKKP